MIEIRIHGRGGQGGVTLAKLISTMRFINGDSVQAFGIYAAERSGAPLQAFCRYDEKTITNRNLIYEPDHVVLLDPTLEGLGITNGLKPGGWILINTPESVESFAAKFPGYRMATIDATAIARANKLGTQTVPIVNTALAGAVAKLLDFDTKLIDGALEKLGFVGNNITAAHTAYEQVATIDRTRTDPTPEVQHPVIPTNRSIGIVGGGGADPPVIHTGDWANQQPRRQHSTPPCNYACPAGNDVQGFLDALAKEDPDYALEILHRTTPFASVCGRVCPAPCMEACNRLNYDGWVNIRDLERYAGDIGKHDVEPLTDRKERIAIIGSGPAGLSAAYHLGKLGYKVKIFERESELGGLLRTGIPPYRLPRDVLDMEIDRILSLNVEAECNIALDREAVKKIAPDFDTILVATGLQQLREIQLSETPSDPGAHSVMQGIEFLELANRNEIMCEGETVIVVGGGNTAIDAARTSFRKGAKTVTIIYRRTRNEMPAIEEEIEHALQEDVSINFLTLPVTTTSSDNGSSFALTCRRMELGEPDDSGRRRPVEIEGSDFDMPCDRVLLALGQFADNEIFPVTDGIDEDVDLSGETKTPMFGCGDIARNDGTVTAAIGSGRRAALSIHEMFTDELIIAAPHDPDHVINVEHMKLHIFDTSKTNCGTTLPGLERRTTEDEVHQGLADPSEAKRCMSCGVCNQCDRCVTFCPDMVVHRVGDSYVFDYDYCKGCGICATECPRDVIYMEHL